LKGLLCGTRRVRSSGKHADLWLTIVDLIADVQRENISITKVAAHQDVSSTVCGFEEWCFLHNCLADSAAQLANTQRSLAFWKAHTKFKQQIEEEARRAHHIQRTLLSISRAVLYQQHADQTAGIDAEIEPDISQSAVACPTPWPGIPEVAGCPRDLVDRFGLRVVTSICNWFFDVFHKSDAANSRWMSFYQLYIDFMQSTGDSGPLHLTSWEDPIDRPQISLLGVSFKKRCSWWTHVVNSLMHAWGMPFQTRFTRPDSLMLLLHTSCLFCPFPDARLDVIDAWLERHLQYPAKPGGRVLNRLPTAGRREVMTVAQSAIQVW